MTSRPRWLFFLLGYVLASISAALEAADSTPSTGLSGALLLTLEGKVEVARQGTAQWLPAQTNHSLRFGDGLRTLARSRATLRLSDLSIVRVNELTTMEIQQPTRPGQKGQLELKSGASYFFSRERPTEIQFRTPVASGAIRGTEFHLAVAENGRTELTLLEGEVSLSAANRELSVGSGEQGTVDPGQAPRKTAVLNPIGIIQWALYYPAVVDPDDLGLSDEAKRVLAESLAAYREGDLLAALQRYPENRAAGSDSEKAFRAALLLAAGQVEQTEALLRDIRADSGPARALRQVIATVKGQRSETSASAASASEWLAQSYHLQSRRKLEEALQAARRATEMSPQFGPAWVRVAELEFSFGRSEPALAALDKGLSLSPRHAQGLALRGFLASANGKWQDALSYFDRAIAVDGALGNAWLGRGLVKIRQGAGADGLRDLQVAATLEPQRGVLRSYLGKAFSHTRDVARAEKELALAIKLDPNDPTPWLYSALLHQQENRVNRAVQELEKSSELNDNRAVYRSGLLLDQDRAVRSANLASIYRDAGMNEVSAREASRAVNYDYGNYSAHLFLANSFDALRDPKQVNLRYEAPWFSELLLANLLAPVGAGNLSQSVSQQEYSRLFDGNHLGLYSSTEYFSNGDWVQSGSQYGYLGNTGYALDAYYRTENGQRPNNDLEQLTLSAKVKQQITPKDSVYFQVQYYDAEQGDVAQYYNQKGDLTGPNAPPAPSLTQRSEEKQEPNLFLGYHHQWSPGVHTLFLGGRLDDDFELEGDAPIIHLTRDPGLAPSFPPAAILSPITLDSDLEAYTVELQQIFQQRAHTAIMGVRYQTGESDTRSFNQDFLGNPVPQDADTDLQRFSVYGYWFWQVAEPLKLMAGLSYDTLDYPKNIDVAPVSDDELNKDQISPKAGFYLTPVKDTTLRGAYTRSLGGVFYDTSVRLEPTQIAGFNQAFRSLIPESVVGLVPGSEFETFGLALDQRFHSRTYLTVAGEILTSEADRSVGAVEATLAPGGAVNLGPSSTSEHLDFEERSVILTLNQLLGDWWSAGATYRYTEADLKERFEEVPAANRDVDGTLHQVYLFLLLNHPSGFFAQADTVWSQQSNHGSTADMPGDDFWQYNFYLGYRFLRRQAQIRLGLLNVTDRDYRLNPVTLYRELPRERTFAASLRFYF